MINKEIPVPIGKCYGSTAVGGHGQMVIPVEARRELGMEAGTKLLAFDFFQGRALLLLKADAVEQLITVITTRLSEFETIAREVTKMTTETNGGSN